MVSILGTIPELTTRIIFLANSWIAAIRHAMEAVFNWGRISLKWFVIGKRTYRARRAVVATKVLAEVDVPTAAAATPSSSQSKSNTNPNGNNRQVRRPHNKSLDASGGGVSRIMIRPAMLD